jgi:histidinol-phosphate aminotransferase
MKPTPLTPVTFTSPTAPASYSWEATSEAVAARYGLAVEDVLRFDLNTSPAPPELAARVLAAGRFDVPVSEYPPSDYRRLSEAAARVYDCATDEILVGAGADEILDLCAKTFLGAGDTAIVPTPSYAMYRVVTEQRGAVARAVARLEAEEGYALDVPAIRQTAATARLIWLCDPNNPTGRPEPDGTIERLLDDLGSDATASGRVPPTVVIDEAYAEFSDRTWLEWRHRYPRLVIVRTMSKAYALAGLRVGFAITRPELVAEIAPYRPPGSVAVPSIAVAAAALDDGVEMRGTVSRITAERERVTRHLAAIGWRIDPSATNFVLAHFADAARAEAVAEGLLAAGLVPRTFPAGHPLAGCLRLTVRTPADHDRLVGVAGALERTAVA